MKSEDLRTLCQNLQLFPELLFFESQGPTARDVRLKALQRRTSLSGLMTTPDELECRAEDRDIRTAGHSESHHIYNPQHEPRVRGYGTIDQALFSESMASEHAHNELEPNWCEGPCTVS